MAQILDGKAVSQRLKNQLKNEVADLIAQKGITPGLAVILVGDDPASQIYVRNKKRACEELGILSEEYTLPGDTTQQQLMALVQELNEKPSIHGILVQLPLPLHLDEKAVINAISPQKDVDAFHPVNVGKIMIGDYDFLPCTPAGIMELIAESHIDITGKNCVVIGRSNIVGKPMAMLLLHQNGTVTITHSKTQHLADITREADILVVAVGKAQMVTGDMIKPGAVVIDVGMNRLPDKKLVGDVDFASAKDIAGYITPVPGGVGPMTIATLMKNVVKAASLYGNK